MSIATETETIAKEAIGTMPGATANEAKETRTASAMCVIATVMDPAVAVLLAAPLPVDLVVDEKIMKNSRDDLVVMKSVGETVVEEEMILVAVMVAAGEEEMMMVASAEGVGSIAMA